MTVAELIAKLQTMEQTLDVVMYHEYDYDRGGYMVVDAVEEEYNEQLYDSDGYRIPPKIIVRIGDKY